MKQLKTFSQPMLWERKIISENATVKNRRKFKCELIIFEDISCIIENCDDRAPILEDFFSSYTISYRARN
jgi:hypothetical protein